MSGTPLFPSAATADLKTAETKDDNEKKLTAEAEEAGPSNRASEPE